MSARLLPAGFALCLLQMGCSWRCRVWPRLRPDTGSWRWVGAVLHGHKVEARYHRWTPRMHHRVHASIAGTEQLFTAPLTSPHAHHAKAEHNPAPQAPHTARLHHGQFWWCTTLQLDVVTRSGRCMVREVAPFPGLVVKLVATYHGSGIRNSSWRMCSLPDAAGGLLYHVIDACQACVTLIVIYQSKHTY